MNKGGINEFLKALFAKFADYDLDCCDHVVCSLRDRDKTPIAGLKYEIRAGTKVVNKGEADTRGLTRRIVVQPGQPAFDVFVSRVEGGMKKISSFVAPPTSAIVNLTSPKAAATATLEKHEGEPGSYRAGRANTGTATAQNSEPKKSSLRGAKGNPVTVVPVPLATGKKLSGAAWEKQFPTSTSLDDLTPSFKAKAGRFIQALETAGVRVKLAATYRPEERAYLMHYCCKIGNCEISPDKVPPMDGVDIEWVHRDPTGKMDVEASRAAAREMMQAYVIRFPAALSSRHTERRAIDMSITCFKDKTVKNADGQDVTIGCPSDLHEIGKTYGVIKLLSDPPHWSDDGR